MSKTELLQLLQTFYKALQQAYKPLPYDLKQTITEIRNYIEDRAADN